MSINNDNPWTSDPDNELDAVFAQHARDEYFTEDRPSGEDATVGELVTKIAYWLLIETNRDEFDEIFFENVVDTFSE